jgi:protein-S-isoprenylcysteine O-methyltransferase Ste14
MSIRSKLAVLACGTAFGGGLALTGLTRPEVVIGFLDVTGHWDPTLGMVLGVALGVNAVLVAVARRRVRPVCGAAFAMPAPAGIDRRLVMGSTLFGAGWGLLGVCPGPALVNLASGSVSTMTFVASMMAGLVLVDAMKGRGIMIKRWAVFAFGSVAYGLFLVTFLYAIGFLGGFGVPKAIDDPGSGHLATALAVDAALLALFAVQHSVMARPWFKALVTRVIPSAAERSLYVLCSDLALLLLFWQWRPIGGTVWTVESPAGRATAYAFFGLGWGTVFVTTFLINHLDLFGLRQVWLHLRQRPYTRLAFATPGFYRHVRHPLYVGWLLVFWATPTMTAAHLLFAVATTAYILVAIRFEERDLEAVHGRAYADYRRQVPMLVPRLRRNRLDAVPIGAVQRDAVAEAEGGGGRRQLAR